MLFLCHAVNQVPSYRLSCSCGYQIKYTLGPVYSFCGVRQTLIGTEGYFRVWPTIWELVT
jgi:hypothetical protein